MKKFLLPLIFLMLLALSCRAKLPDSLKGVWYESSPDGYGTLVMQFVQTSGKAEVLIDDISLLERIAIQNGEKVFVENLKGLLGKYELQAIDENTWSFTVSEGQKVFIAMKGTDSIGVEGLTVSAIIDILRRREIPIREGMRTRVITFTKRR